MPRPLTLAFLLAAALGCGPADRPAPTNSDASNAGTERAPGDKELTEKDKIEALIKHVEGLDDAVFVRNGSEYDAKTAAKFLRGKWDKEPDVKTARDFIAKVASKSSTSGKPYTIRLKDGTEAKSADYLAKQLEKIEKGARP
jgi:hypothetical protein